jgi:hypothetical protein
LVLFGVSSESEFANGPVVRFPLKNVNIPRELAVLLAVALVVRCGISVASVGSNDIYLWRHFATQIEARGLMATYQEQSWFNHPPLSGLLQWGWLRLSEATGLRFSFFVKALPILADVLVIGVVWRALNPAPWVLWALALNPINLMICAYHGNTDSLCAALCFLAVVCLERKRFYWAGALLAGALNVKLLPAVLVLPFFVRGFRLGGARAVLELFAVCLLGSMPFWPVFAYAGSAFYANAIAYKSIPFDWGFLHVGYASAAAFPAFSGGLATLLAAYGKVVVLLGAWLLGSVIAYRDREPTLTGMQMGAACFAWMLFFAPGFGVQYLVCVSAFLLLAKPRSGLDFALSGGVFLFLIYAGFWTGTWPATSWFHGRFNELARAVGMLPWLVLGGFVAVQCWQQCEAIVTRRRSRV